MPIGYDGATVAFLRRELEASLYKIGSLEKENHELKQETTRLKSQISALKAHDLERKSILWKKLQNTMDEPPQKPKLHIDDVLPVPVVKKPNSCYEELAPKGPKPPPPSPPQWLHRRVTAPPPPPPPLPSTPVGLKTVRRVPAVMEFYRSLMKRESTYKENKNGVTGLVPVTYSRDMIGEIENRSTYLSSVSLFLLHGSSYSFEDYWFRTAVWTIYTIWVKL